MYKFSSRECLDLCTTTTDRDRESQRHEKVNVWICARQTTHHDLVSVIPDEREKREREVKHEKCKSVTVAFFADLMFFFELRNSVRIFLVRILILTKWFLNLSTFTTVIIFGTNGITNSLPDHSRVRLCQCLIAPLRSSTDATVSVCDPSPCASSPVCDRPLV